MKSDTDEVRERKRYYTSILIEDLYLTELKKLKEKKENECIRKKRKNYTK